MIELNYGADLQIFMTPNDRNYLNGVLSDFIEASINRTSHSGHMIFRYRLTADEIRSATGRQRMHDSVADDVLDFFRMASVDADFNRQFGAFDITLNLSTCALSPAQARDLSAAMETYRAEHNL